MYVFSDIENSHAFEWMAEYTNSEKYNVHYVFMHPHYPQLANRISNLNQPTHFIKYKGKRDLISTLWQLCQLMRKFKPDIVHTHLFEANIAGLTAAWLCGIKKRIYTRHHSTYHHQYHHHAIKYDKYCNYVATHIVAITKNVHDVLVKMENVPAEKITIVHHGFVFKNFKNIDIKRIQNLKKKYDPDDQQPVIGVISRFTKWKGVQYIIPAFKRLLTAYPDALLVLANANGDYKYEIESLLKELPEKNFKTIAFEQDIAALYRFFDIFIHVPVDEHSEAFGQVYVEALASKLPCIFTLSGIANDFIKNDVNAVVVDYKNEIEIHSAIIKILENRKFAERISTAGNADVERLFSIEQMIKQLETIYEQ